jgi:hypothetical protein
MRTARRIVCLAVIGLLAAALPSLGQDVKPKAKPMSEADLIKLAKADLEDEVLIGLVKKRGLSFKPDAAALKRLKEAGVSAAVLAAIQQPKDDAKAAENSGKPLGTGRYQKGLVIDVTELKRTSDGFLKVSFRIRNPTNQSVTHTVSGAFFVPEMNYVEVGGKFKHNVARDNRDNYLASHVPGTVTLRANETAEYWAKFGQPAAGISRLTLYFRQTEPIEDIPVPPPAK